MPFPGYHAARIADPDNYSKKRYAKGEFGDGIDVIYGITPEGKAEVQAVRFDKNIFTEKQTRDWLKKHPEHKPIEFEPASEPAKMQKATDPLDRFQKTLFDLSQDPGYSQVHYCQNCRLQKTEGHDAILQGLDRKVGKLYFGKDRFIPTVNDWNTRPIIFSKLHPDPDKFDADMEAELTRIQGGITGDLSDAALENVVGKPRLNVRKNYSDDVAMRFYDAGLISVDTLNRSFDAIPRTLQLIADKKLSHSSAFRCPDDGESLYGIVKPHHVLDFEETPTDKPVDAMVAILNKQEHENVTEETAQLHVGKVISAKNAGKLRSAFDALKAFVEEIMNGNEEAPAPAEPQMNKTEGEMNTPGGEPLTDQKNDAPAQEQKMTPEEQKMMDDKDAMIASLKAKIAEMEGGAAKTQKAIEDMQASLKAHEDAKVQAQKAKFDTEWAALEASIIPPGEIKAPEDKARLQKMSIDEPLAFAAKVAGWKSAPKKGEEGNSHTNGPTGNDNAELNRILAANAPAIPGRLH